MKIPKTVLPEIVYILPILIICIFAYYTAFTKVGFVSDDFFWKPFFSYTPSELINLLIAQRAGEINLIYFRPVVVYSHQLEYLFFGDNPFGYHLTNVLLHTANAVLLFAFCRTIGLSRLSALAASLFFGVYPAHSEIVTWISGRADLSALFFLLISLLLWRRAWDKQYHVAWVILSAVCFILAGWGKEVAAAGILIFPVMDLCLAYRRKYLAGTDTKLFHWKRYTVLLLCLFGLILVRIWLFGDIGGHSDTTGHSKYFQIDFAHIWLVVSSYTTILFTPVSGVVWEESSAYWRTSIIISGIIFALILTTFLYTIFISRNNKQNKILLTICLIIGLTWMIAMYLPVLPLLPVMRTLIRARFMYSPSVGLSIIVGAGFGILLAHKLNFVKILSWVSLIIVLTSSVYLLNCQNQLWVDSSRLSEQINSIIVSNTEHLGDRGSIILVNIPVEEGYKGIECMPVMTTEYFRCLFGFKDVRIFFIAKEADIIPDWWLSLKTRQSNTVGFVCEGDLQSFHPLP